MKKPALASDSADHQAALWAARLDGSILSTTDRLALEAWLNQHPSHRAQLSAYCQFSADLEQQLPLIAGIRELSAEAPEKTVTARSYSRLRRPLMAGVALTAAAAVALGFWLAHSPFSAPSTMATPIAQRHAFVLADGSRVELNAQTNLMIEFNARERHVRLADGEAFFTVQKDPSRPFIVETPAGSVRVTGTQFNVRTETPGQLEIIVREGSVQARPAGANTSAIALTPAQHLVSGPAGTSITMLTEAELTASLAWRQGQVVFDHTPLRDALARFARYHGRGLTANAATAGLHIGGRFSLDDLDGFLSMLEEVLPVQVNRHLNGSVQVDPRPQLASSGQR